MATLEVHDGAGRVERLVISREQPAMFGRSPKCEIVVAGDDVLPFHGRIRWQPKKKRFKVDASPEAEYVLVNGHKMTSSSLRQGDEIQVGRNRIFLINEGEPSFDEPLPPPRDDATRVQPPPFASRPAPRTAMPPRSPSPFEDPDFLEPLTETAVADPALVALETVREGRRRRGREMPAKARPDEPVRGWRRLFYVFSRRSNAPGHERIVSSPLVFGLFASFVALVLIGFVLYGVILRATATRLYTQAVENLEDGDYRNALRRFDEFVKANPKDRRVGQARVHREMANVRQYTGGAAASWSLALEAERAMVEAVGAEPAYKDSAPELDELVIRTGESLADRARTTSDPKALAEAESTVELHDRVAGPAADALLKKSRLPEKLATARAAVKKARFRGERLVAMDAALKAGSSAGVYESRDLLVAAYPDQAEDRDLIARMKKANDLIRKAVRVDTSGRPAVTEPHDDPLGPPTTLVLRSREGEAGTTPADGPMVYAVADGLAFGLDATTGGPIWQVPVGLGSSYAPIPIPGGSTVLAFDARHDELVRLEARTGKLVWRQTLEERAVDPPLVLGNQILQMVPSGKLIVIDLPTGSVRATVECGLKLKGTPVHDESGQALYLTAEEDCLFVLSRDPLACAAVEYLGHRPGSIGAPPARVGRYLIVPENDQINEGRWRVFVLAEDGLSLTPVQSVGVLGWTWGTPAAAGSVVWSAGDRGGVAAFGLGEYGSKDPFRLIARVPPDAKPSGPAFPLARTEREVWVGSGRSGRYDLNPETAKVGATWTLVEAGPAVAAPQMAGSTLVMTQQYADGPGVALWGVDPQSGAVAWRTVVGVAWPSAPAPTGDGKSFTALGVDGSRLALSHEALTRGGFVASPLPKPGKFRVPTGALARVEGDGWTALVPAMGGGKLLVRKGGGEFREVDLPAPAGARPTAWGAELFVACVDGRAYLVDPLTGESRAEPFVPPFDRTKPTRWMAPVRLGDDAVALADDSGRVRRLVRVSDPRPRLSVAAEVSLGKGIIADPAATAGAIVLATDDGRVRALSTRDLGPVGAWPLDAPLAGPPATVGGRCYLADAAGGVVAIGEDGQRAWTVKLVDRNGPAIPLGPPAIRGDAAWFLDRAGTLHARGLADGASLANVPLDVLPAGGPLGASDDLVVPVGLGSVRLLVIDSTSTSK